MTRLAAARNSFVEQQQPQVTAAQKAHKSLKSKTTQSILKRLKQNIEAQSKVTAAVGSQQSSALPSQLSDAYTTMAKSLMRQPGINPSTQLARKPRTKENSQTSFGTLQRRQNRQSASPQESQPINLISSVRASIDSNKPVGAYQS